MKLALSELARSLKPFVVLLFFFLLQSGSAQSGSGLGRSFPQSKPTIEKALSAMQASTAGRLPSLEGFATAAQHPLDRYQRGYYQAKFQVNAAPGGGCLVHVSVEVTALYSDPTGGNSGYQVVPSNGRLEADMLDQLAEQVASKTPAQGAKPASGDLEKATRTPKSTEPTISAPVPRIPDSSSGLSSSLAQSLAEQEKAAAKPGSGKIADQSQSELQAVAQGLEEILRNQAHPKNLVAVKKSGTPVVASASLTAKTLFLASAHDEFEMLDFNRDWVHVRISGLSRGWIWRDNLEMPDSVPDSDLPANPASEIAAADLFHVSREEEATFPGDWAPLRNKMVKIVSVENTNETVKDPGPKVRLEFVKSLLDKNYGEIARPPQQLAGIVVIFDAADGGMIAAPLSTLQQWKAGTLSDAALWHRCFFDPPETFGENSGVAASQ